MDDILRDLIDLARQIINKSLSLRRALDNQTPSQFVPALAVYAKSQGFFSITLQGSGFDFEPPAGEFRGDVDRIEWVKGRLTVIRELGELDADAHAWLEGAAALVRKAGGIEKFDTATTIEGQSLRGWYKSSKDELEKLRAWTIPARDFSKGVLKAPGQGLGFINDINSVLNRAGLDLDKILAAAAAGAAAVSLVLVALLIWAIFFR